MGGGESAASKQQIQIFFDSTIRGGRRPTLKEIREWCSKAWSLTGKISLSALRKGLIWIHFECEEDMNKVLEKGQYWVGKTAMFLHRWCPGLDLDELLLSTWVVWYEMSGVPLGLYNAWGLKSLVGMVGKFIAFVWRACLDFPDRS